jgi:hypothetical protein
VVALLLAVGSGWFGWRTPGFALLALAWTLARVAQMMARIEHQSLLETGKQAPTGTWFELAIDAAFVTLAAWRSEIPQTAALSFAFAWFAPLVLMLLLHFLPRVMPTGAATWWLRDRLLAGVGFAVSSAVLPFDLCVRTAVVALLVWALAKSPPANPDLTKPV